MKYGCQLFRYDYEFQIYGRSSNSILDPTHNKTPSMEITKLHSLTMMVVFLKNQSSKIESSPLSLLCLEISN